MYYVTRSEETGICEFQTFKEAINHAKEDKTVWKISFNVGEAILVIWHALRHRFQ